jgi:hypothetical protein
MVAVLSRQQSPDAAHTSELCTIILSVEQFLKFVEVRCLKRLIRVTYLKLHSLNLSHVFNVGNLTNEPQCFLNCDVNQLARLCHLVRLIRDLILAARHVL